MRIVLPTLGERDRATRRDEHGLERVPTARSATQGAAILLKGKQDTSAFGNLIDSRGTLEGDVLAGFQVIVVSTRRIIHDGPGEQVPIKSSCQRS
jgi:hypothetical protein